MSSSGQKDDTFSDVNINNTVVHDAMALLHLTRNLNRPLLMKLRLFAVRCELSCLFTTVSGSRIFQLIKPFNKA